MNDSKSKALSNTKKGKKIQVQNRSATRTVLAHHDEQRYKSRYEPGEKVRHFKGLKPM